MKAMILAAGLGTRLRPWTLSHPKALVPVAGRPMLARVVERLRDSGFSRIVVNVHHFADQIIDFLDTNDFGIEIHVSDERGRLLDTGGGLLHARGLLEKDDEPFLVHNADILSSADLAALMHSHRSGTAATLLVSDRNSSRKLVFNTSGTLLAWHNLSEERWKPESHISSPDEIEMAFSGIYVLSPDSFRLMERNGFHGAFPVMDFLLSEAGKGTVKGHIDRNLKLIDIGKPETLSRANEVLLNGDKGF